MPRPMPRASKKRGRPKSDDSDAYTESEEESEEEEEDSFVPDDEFEEEEEEGIEEDEEDDDDLQDVKPEARKRPAPSTTKKTTESTAERARKRRSYRKYQDDLSDMDYDEGDASHRLTERGGYAHKKVSKLRISRANKGNTPWNKGGNRSAADKAKISAGVRARNRAVLLEKLKVLGMTEEEWETKKKQIKYIRERVRRAKVAKDEKLVKEQQKMLDAALAETEGPTDKQASHTKTDNKKKSKAETKKAKAPISKQKGVIEIEYDDKSKDVEDEAEEVATEMPALTPTPELSFAPPVPAMPKVFRKDVQWTDNSFDLKGADGRFAYQMCCPTGGPGGLICCTTCSKAYTVYLGMSTKDIEEQRLQNASKEVSDLLEYLARARSKLDEAEEMAQDRMGKGPRPKMSSAARAIAAPIKREVGHL